jgi:hypothetical protein
MSYDLAVWHAAHRLSDEEAANVYQALCEAPATELPALVADPRVARFYGALTQRYVELEDDKDQERFSPWSAGLDRSERHVIMPMVFSRVGDVVPTVHALAREHGLHLYDPQEGRLYGPTDPLPAMPRPGSPDAPVAPDTVIERFRAALTPVAAEAGFRPSADARRSTVAFERTGEGVIVTLSWSYDAGEVGVAIVVDSKQVASIYAEVAQPPPWTKALRMPLRGLFEARRGGAWMDAHGVSLAAGDAEQFSPAATTEGSLTAAITSAKNVLSRFGVPAAATLDSMTKLAAFYGRPTRIGNEGNPPRVSAFVAAITGRLSRHADWEAIVAKGRETATKGKPAVVGLGDTMVEHSTLEDYERLVDLLRRMP